MYDIYQVVNYRRFRPYVVGNARLEVLHTGMRWAEGPVWFADSGCLLLSDVPSNRILRWVEGQGASVYREPSKRADFDPALASRTRRAFLERYCGTDVVVCATHFPFPSLGRIVPRGGAGRAADGSGRRSGEGSPGSRVGCGGDNLTRRRPWR